MGNQDNALLDATVNLYRAVSSDLRSTPEEVVVRFAKKPIDESLESYSGIYGKIPSHGSILKGDFDRKSVEDILADL